MFRHAPRFWDARSGLMVWLMPRLLAPLAKFYGWVVARRLRQIVPQKLDLPVICIGNFTLGGAGKTPSALYVASRFAAWNQPPAILLRGYRGAQSHRALRALRVLPAQHTAQQVGDEALMLGDKYPTYIGADRAASGALAQSEGAQILIKDDGFQNPHLAHDINLLVIDGESGLGNGCVFPSGPLREPLDSAWERVSALLIIGAAIHPTLAQLPDDRPRFHAKLRVMIPRVSRGFAFCGIGRAEKFFAPLRNAGVLVGQRAFNDHHFYSNADAAAILDAAQAAHATPLTTAKDMIRLKTAHKKTATAKLAQAAQIVDVVLELDEPSKLDAYLKKQLGL